MGRKQVALFVTLAVIVAAIIIIERPSVLFGSAGASTASSANSVAIENGKAPGASRNRLATSTRIDPVAIISNGPLSEDVVAPDLVGISVWINSEPFKLMDLRGKVVLVDFWTYTCVNCVRTLPYIKEWHSKYSSKGLVVVGVHSPEFAFEKERANVEKAVKEFQISYPVAMDNGFETWKAYSNRFWPHKYLIDKDGLVRYHMIGEGRYQETEEWIQRLLAEAGTKVSDGVTAQDPEFLDQILNASVTRELYAGYQRDGGHLANQQTSRDPDIAMEYKDPNERENGLMYAKGPWFHTPEALRHSRTTSKLEDYIAIYYSARSVNAVIRPEGAEPFKVYLTLDGKAIEQGRMGADVMADEEGKSYILVESARMYHLIQTPKLEAHELRLSSNSDGFGLYAFTFGY